MPKTRHKQSPRCPSATRGCGCTTTTITAAHQQPSLLAAPRSRSERGSPGQLGRDSRGRTAVAWTQPSLPLGETPSTSGATPHDGHNDMLADSHLQVPADALMAIIRQEIQQAVSKTSSTQPTTSTQTPSTVTAPSTSSYQHSNSLHTPSTSSLCGDTLYICNKKYSLLLLWFLSHYAPHGHCYPSILHRYICMDMCFFCPPTIPPSPLRHALVTKMSSIEPSALCTA